MRMAPHRRRENLRRLIHRYGHIAIANVTGAEPSAIARYQAALPIRPHTAELIDRAFRTLGNELGLDQNDVERVEHRAVVRLLRNSPSSHVPGYQPGPSNNDAFHERLLADSAREGANRGNNDPTRK
jgi:hypothetical protein